MKTYERAVSVTRICSSNKNAIRANFSLCIVTDHQHTRHHSSADHRSNEGRVHSAVFDGDRLAQAA